MKRTCVACHTDRPSRTSQTETTRRGTAGFGLRSGVSAPAFPFPNDRSTWGTTTRERATEPAMPIMEKTPI